MDYFILILTFLGGTIAIIGNTWDDKKVGLKKLTITGRFTAIIVLLGFIISIKTTYTQNEEKKVANKMAAEEIDRHLNSLIYPFSVLLWEVNGKSYDYSLDTIDLLLDNNNMEKIGEIDIRKDTPHYQGVFYNVISNSHNNGREGLDRVIRFYSNVIDSEIRVLIQKLANNYYYDSLVNLDRYKPSEKELKNTNGPFSMYFRNISGTGVDDERWKFYKEHIETIKQIKILNDKTIAKYK